ncbi:vitronectin-like isoform X2 [Myxocyprinus asiaticus]|uniref:vitronectin-like isoform X2 n=1 Tax=Myxocyprinus asiaticus TaxID=70543 RepID=UPI002221F5B5|nr:vitronectin-like isoform X2 [Myxocyprinus asiaticus]
MRNVILSFLVIATSFAAEETCLGRCQSGFDPTKKCQCDTMCKYYGSCCEDFDTTCRKKIARGDTFEEPEKDLTLTTTEESVVATTTVLPQTTAVSTPTLPPDPKAVTCSGRTFDAFMQLKNGSIYAFRGDYFFELDDQSVMPGYPKLIKDVWGISGPIDAAFTRINCQGKTYIFKGNKYWRFDGDVLDEDYPRDISVGFEKIPDYIDAAFAIPAPGHHGKEKVYFFKSDQYYQYEFKHQPSHEECDRMTKSSPSVAFTHYTDLYCDLDNMLTLLFQGFQGHHKGPRFISKDWIGIKPPVDAAMLGRLYVSPVSSPSPATSSSRGRTRQRKKNKGRGSRDSHSLFWDDFGLDYEERYHGAEKHGKNHKKGRGRRPSFSFFDMSYDPEDYTDVVVVQEKAMPVQNVYFFKKDKYYRVDLQTKRIDYVNPPYPRSIAKYWLGCKEKDLSEKK